VQTKLARSVKDSQHQLETATTHLREMTERLNQVQSEAHAFRIQLQDAEQNAQMLESKLQATGQAVVHADAALHNQRLEQCEELLLERQNQMRNLEAALHQAQKQKVTLEDTVGSLIVMNDDLHMHVHKVLNVVTTCVSVCPVLLHGRNSECCHSKAMVHDACHLQFSEGTDFFSHRGLSGVRHSEDSPTLVDRQDLDRGISS
jgi:hypothetical protein